MYKSLLINTIFYSLLNKINHIPNIITLALTILLIILFNWGFHQHKLYKRKHEQPTEDKLHRN